MIAASTAVCRFVNPRDVFGTFVCELRNLNTTGAQQSGLTALQHGPTARAWEAD